jgi:hypothetical protein
MVLIQSFPKSLFKYALIATLPEKKAPEQGAFDVWRGFVLFRSRITAVFILQRQLWF